MKKRIRTSTNYIMSERPIRVRFAPSPTGPLHIGGVRTALFNYLFARKHGGTFILRIEDTDQTRYVEGAEQYIIEALEWCNIPYDEGVDAGGEFAPYRQSERKDIYRRYASQLIEAGHAYYAFDTADELEAMRERLKAEKSSSQQYDATTRGTMKNSLSLPDHEVETRLESGEPYVIRYKMPENETVVMHDIVRGEISVTTSTLDDKVLFKSDGLPTYHLANIVDDHLMQISHVIRGEEWLPSLPLHVLLYRSLGWESEMPEFAHLPLILKPSGKGKLSKRDGEKMGFPVFPLQWHDPKTGEEASGYRESGYLPEAFINMLAFLGWNPGTEQEIFSLEELVEAFDLEKVGKASAKFDPEKARWFNQQYIRQQSPEALAQAFIPMLYQQNLQANFSYIKHVCSLVQERISFVSEIWEQGAYFFETPENYDAKTVKKRWKSNVPELMRELRRVLSKIEPFDSETVETQVKEWLNENDYGMGKVMNAFRLVLVGGSFGVHLFDIAAAIGKEETIQRIDTALAKLPETKPAE